MRKILALIILLPSLASAQGERFLYSAEVNRFIPDDDSTGIRDTIFIPQHIIISDINFFVEAGYNDLPWAEEALIDVFSPSSARVRLNDWAGDVVWWYGFWYDTDREEDGPGQLEDYSGSDAYGAWEMFCFDPFYEDSICWYFWRIEVWGDPYENVGESQSTIPTDYAIDALYPNPFNGQIVISYAVPRESAIRIEIYDIGGRRIRRLLDGSSSAGYFRAVWNGRSDANAEVSSGIYIFKLTGPDKEVLKRATLLK